ncbi:hypothetical protein JW979_03900 [bacterium]|nr:hypothetical protein [candidate division CSSED10-310 bacterium]
MSYPWSTCQISRWFPVEISQIQTNTVLLYHGDGFYCEIPGQSALKIYGTTSDKDVEIFRVFFCGESDHLNKAFVKETNIILSDHSIEIPTPPGAGQTFYIKAIADHLELSCYRLVNFSPGFFWEPMIKSLTREFQKGRNTISIVNELLESDPSHWIQRDMKKCISFSESIDSDDTWDPNRFLMAMITEKLMVRSLIDRENVYTEDLLCGDSVPFFSEKSGNIRSIVYRKINGPALIRLEMRCEFLEDWSSVEKIVDVHTFLDSARINENPIKFHSDYPGRRWIRSNIPSVFDPDEEAVFASRWSQAKIQYYYIPSGSYCFRLVSNDPLYISGHIYTPVHDPLDKENSILIQKMVNHSMHSKNGQEFLKFLTCVQQMDNLSNSQVDPIDMENLYYQNRTDPLARILYDTGMQLLELNTIRMEAESRVFLDSVSPVLSLKSEMSTIYEAGPRYYRIPDKGDFTVQVPYIDPMDYTPVRFYDVEGIFGSRSTELFVDGRQVFIKDKVGLADSIEFTVCLRPGNHSLKLNNNGAPVYCNIPIIDSVSNLMWLREYYHVPTDQKKALKISINPQEIGHRLRVMSRTENAEDTDLKIYIQTDTGRVESVMCDMPAGRQNPSGFFYDIPAGAKELNIWADSKAWITLSSLNKVKDTQHKIQTVKLSTSQNLLKIPLMWFSPWKDLMLGVVVLKQMGYANSALEVGNRLSPVNNHFPEWFCRIMMETALVSGKPYDSWLWMHNLLEIHPEDTQAIIAKARLMSHFGNIPGALDILDSIDMMPIMDRETLQWMARIENYDIEGLSLPDNWMYFSPNPRFVSTDCIAAVKSGRKVALINRFEKFYRDAFNLPFSNAPDYWICDPEDEYEITVNGPGVLKIVTRPNHILSNGLYETDDFTLCVQRGKMDFVFRFPENRCESQNYIYDGTPEVRPGEMEEIYIPLQEGHQTVKLRCLRGSGSFRVEEQLPGIDDNPRKRNFPDMEQIYLEILEKSATDITQPAHMLEAYVKMVQICQRYPDCILCKPYSKWINQFLSWKALLNFSSEFGRWTMISKPFNTSTVSGNMTEEFGSSEHGFRLSNDKTLTIPLDNYISGIIECHVDGFRDAALPFSVNVSLDGALKGTLTSGNTFLRFPWKKSHGTNLSFYYVDGSLPESLEITAVLIQKDSEPLTLKPTRILTCYPTAVLQPVEGNIIGPAVVKCLIYKELNAAEDNMIPFRIQFRDASEHAIGEHIVPVSFNGDPISVDVIHQEKHYQCDLVESELLLPIDFQGLVHVQIEPQEDSHRFYCRFAAPVFKYLSDRHSVDSQWYWPEISPENGNSDQLTVEEIPWKSNVPPELPLSKQSGGTWVAHLYYRDRSEVDSYDEHQIFSSDGITAEVGFHKRIEGYSVYLESLAGISAPASNTDNNIGLFHQNTRFNFGKWNVRSGLDIDGYVQKFHDDTAFSFDIDTDVRKTYRPFKRFCLVPALQFSLRYQSLNSKDILLTDSVPDPSLFNYFDDRHPFSAGFQTTLHYELFDNVRFYSRFKTITAGDYETGLFSPWWWESGVHAFIGSVMIDLSYTERKTFGESLEPDRSRLQASLSLYQWTGLNMLWCLDLSDRFTFDTEQNDITVGLVLRFNAGRLLRDDDPNQRLFKERLERLAL